MADDLQVSPDLLENPLLAPSVGQGKLPWEQFKPLMQRFESNFRNVPNYLFNPGHTASGVNQITNTTWNRYADAVGAPRLEWPHTPMDRPIEEQNKVAQAIYQQEGPRPWANYNPRLASALAPYGFKAGGIQPSAHPDISAPLPNQLFDPKVVDAGQQSTQTLPETAVSPAAQGMPDPQNHLLMVLGILKALMGGTHSFTPVDYDPWAAVRKMG